MLYKKLGRTGIEVSEYALGCWPFAGGDVWGDQSDETSIAAVHAALDAGINFFDTAEAYGDGRSERVLGLALAGRRDEAVIATKVSASNLSPDGIMNSCERSLEYLRTEYIDLYQVHWPSWSVPLAETMGALKRLKEQGKVRALGVCNFGVRDLADLLEVGAVETDQLPYSLLWRVIEDAIQPVLLANEIGIICYTPLAQGLLTGRYASADEVPEGLARTRHFAGSRPQVIHGDPGCEAEAFAAIEAVRRVADGLGEPMSSVALAWARQQRGVTSLLVGARSPEEVLRNVPAFDLTLAADTVSELSAVTEEVKLKIGPNPDMWHSESRMR
jgi:aryl-alcohol dehydrogenase-like predicted oxidoreductase